MTEWAAKRFWTDVAVTDATGGFGIALDDRPVRTPGKRPLVVPTRAMADMIAAEWRDQTGTIDPGTMPATRAANSALEKVAPVRAKVAAHLAAYAETDLLCYRADAPDALVARQAAAWDPLLDWAREDHGADLRVTTGVMPVDQPPAALAALAAPVHALDPFALAGFHDLVALSGSLVLALAVIARRLPPEDAWALSRLDEAFQIEQWGEDEDAAETAEIARSAFLDAARFYFAA